jgi:predicted helicase
MAENKATIYYHDIGDYLDRDKKLKIIKEYGSVKNPKMEWTIITPNEKHDWINQRDGVFDNLISLGNNKDKEENNKFFYPVHTNGLKTQRDAWCYNYSTKYLSGKMKDTIDFYNSECQRFAKIKDKDSIDILSFINPDSTKISWTEALRNDLKKCDWRNLMMLVLLNHYIDRFRNNSCIKINNLMNA